MVVTVIGDGGWGTCLAVNLSKSGNDVRLWGAFPDYVKETDRRRENVKFLPGVPIPSAVKITSDTEEAVAASKLVVVAVPSQHVRETLGRFKGLRCSKAGFVSVVKGIEVDTLHRMSEVIREVLGDIKIAVLSGPSIAYEVARSMPTTVVAASSDISFARDLQRLFMTETFRVYTSSDVVGVELGGALKNIIAIASGIADGLGFGANSKAAILTRGIQELTRLGIAMGARRETFSGLSCMGDLITTCMSGHSRNRWLGEEVGKGKKPADVIASTEMAVEGYATTKSAHELSKKHHTEMPITNQMYEILYKGKEPRSAVRDLMTRAPKEEIY